MALEIENKSINNQYELLNILDGKASALLSFNSIFLASISIWLGYVPPNYLHLVLDFVFVLLLLSCYSLLKVIYLKWTDITEVEGRTDLEVTQVLDEIRRKRTIAYQRAWNISSGSIVVVGVISVVHSLGTGLVALDFCGASCHLFFGELYFGNMDIGSK